MKTNLYKAILGTLVGDSIGLPMEGLSPRKIEKLGWVKQLRQRFIFGKGMWSDDTDHTLLLTEALLLSGGDVEKFQKLFSRRLRFWFSTLPPGIGLATLGSIVKQYLGVPLDKTGIFSAGNGPSMRAAVIGVLYAHDPLLREAYNKVQTKLTHSDPKALEASELVVEIAATFVNGGTNLQGVLKKCGGSPHGDWGNLIGCVVRALESKVQIEVALQSFGITPEKGVSGYSYHTVPVVVYVGMKNNWHFQKTITELISLGGDTDSTSAIAGALCALHPESEIPTEWSRNFCEFPISVSKIEEVCQSMKLGHQPIFYHWWLWPLYLLRNLFQFVVILFHVTIRCFPACLAKLVIK